MAVEEAVIDLLEGGRASDAVEKRSELREDLAKVAP